jgi:hypothetical protein
MNKRTKGNNFERKIITEINNLPCGYHVGSSRMYSRFMDNNLVDIVDIPGSIKQIPYHIQCKSLTGYVRYDELFSDFKLKDKPLVLFHGFTEKRGTRFFQVSDYVVMRKEEFYEILKSLNNGNIKDSCEGSSCTKSQ